MNSPVFLVKVSITINDVILKYSTVKMLWSLNKKFLIIFSASSLVCLYLRRLYGF